MTKIILCNVSGRLVYFAKYLTAFFFHKAVDIISKDSSHLNK